MNTYYDEREAVDPAAREQHLLARLPAQIAHAKTKTSAFAALLYGIDPNSITGREALATLPVIRKSSLLKMQKNARPFGGFAAVGWGRACPRVFCSPGPLYEPEGTSADYYRMARALYAAGFRQDDLVHNTFSYHFTPAGMMMESAAHALGCTVFPAGVGQTEQQLAAIADLQPNAYVGTPSFLRILLERMEAEGIRNSFTKAFVSGEAFPSSLRDSFQSQGVDAYQGYATADLGLIAYESNARQGLILSEDLLLEIVRPGTDDPVPPGEIGEVVVTTLTPEYPLIRFGTGDLSAILPQSSACGRTNMRIRGWLGRADQTAKVKGMFVHPEQVAAICRHHSEIIRARLVIENPGLTDCMTLYCEITQIPTDHVLQDRIVDSIRQWTKLRGAVQFVARDSLAKDGKVIDDLRQYD